MENIQTEEVKTYRSPLCNPSIRHKTRKLRKERRKLPNTLDLKKIRAWAQVGCTLEEIAYLLGVTPGWLSEMKAKDFDLEDALLDGVANFKHSLRSTQARLALSGHPGMLIWLGKQFLGQSDKQESKTETTVNVVLQNAMKELRESSQEDILRIKQIIEGSAVDVTPQD